MSIDEAIFCMKSYVPEYGGYELCDGCKYYASKEISKNVFVCSSGEARKIAIEALNNFKNTRDVDVEMNVDEALICMNSYLFKKGDSGCRKCKYYYLITGDGEMSYCKSSEAHKMAIAALEEMLKIRECGDDGCGV